MNTNNAPEQIELPISDWFIYQHRGRWHISKRGNFDLYLSDTSLWIDVLVKDLVAMRPQVSESEGANDPDWQWLVGKEYYLGTVEDVCGETATLTYGDDTFRIRISELLEEDEKCRLRKPAEPNGDTRKLREVIGYAIARLEDDEIEQALNTLKVAR